MKIRTSEEWFAHIVDVLGFDDELKKYPTDDLISLVRDIEDRIRQGRHEAYSEGYADAIATYNLQTDDEDLQTYLDRKTERPM